MNKNAILNLADHLEYNVQDKEFDYSDSSRCVLGHANRRQGIRRRDREYMSTGIEVFGSRLMAELVFRGVEFKYKGDTKSFIKRLLGVPKGPEIEIQSFMHLGYSRMTRMKAVGALRSLAETGEYKF